MKLAEQTAAKIELAIAERGWPLGTVLGSEADLLAQYGVSRAVLREAVRLLEHDNVARMRRGPGGGLVVAEPDPEAVTRTATLYLRYRGVDPGQIFDARIALELAAVRGAVERIDEAGIDRLRAALAAEPTPATAEVCAPEFHVMLADLSGNPAIQLFVDVVTKLTTATALGSAALDGSPAPREPEELHSVHGAIAEAVVAGDVALAQHRMTRHLQSMARALSGERDTDHDSDHDSDHDTGRAGFAVAEAPAEAGLGGTVNGSGARSGQPREAARATAEGASTARRGAASGHGGQPAGPRPAGRRRTPRR